MDTKDDLKHLLPFCSEELCKAKREEFIVRLTDRIRNTVNAHSLLRKLADISYLNPGESAMYDMNNYKFKRDDPAIFILPKAGFVPWNFVEGSGEKVFIPTFTIGTSFGWHIKYIEAGRMDIIERAVRLATKALIDYENDSLFRVLSPAATCNLKNATTYDTRVIKIDEKSIAAGFFSKELIKEMFVKMYNKGYVIDLLLISPEDLADFREWSEDGSEDSTYRREIFISGGPSDYEIEHNGNTYTIKLMSLEELGMTGKYNINGRYPDASSIFKVNNKGEFNDYSPDHANMVDEKGNLVKAGETQIYGIDTSNKPMVMPIRSNLSLFDDPNALKTQQVEYYGWQEIGIGLLNSDAVIAGAIDRSVH